MTTKTASKAKTTESPMPKIHHCQSGDLTMKPLAGAEVSDFGTRFGFEAAGSNSSEGCSRKEVVDEATSPAIAGSPTGLVLSWATKHPNRIWTKHYRLRPQVHGTGGMLVSARPLNRYIDHRRCSMADRTADSRLNPNRSLEHMPGFR